MAGDAPTGSRLQGLAPVVDADARCLILGSFPSPASLAAGQYYAHPQNQFWRLLGGVLGEDLPALAYAERVGRVSARGVAIWDIYACCRRDGALDSAIRDGEINDFERLFELAPKLGRVLFNGQTAGRLHEPFRARGLAVAVLPSSSPAYTLAYADKLARWRHAFSACVRTDSG